MFVFADDHAYQAISAYGSKINQTPNIDRLAEEGIRFDRCLVTNSICAPARAVILSGRYSHLNGVVDNRLEFNGSQQTFSKLLQGAGYQTAIVGKWQSTATRREQLALARELLAVPVAEPANETAGADSAQQHRCPLCRQGRMLLVETFEPPRPALFVFFDTS